MEADKKRDGDNNNEIKSPEEYKQLVGKLNGLMSDNNPHNGKKVNTISEGAKSLVIEMLDIYQKLLKYEINALKLEGPSPITLYNRHIHKKPKSLKLTVAKILFKHLDSNDLNTLKSFTLYDTFSLFSTVKQIKSLFDNNRRLGKIYQIGYMNGIFNIDMQELELKMQLGVGLPPPPNRGNQNNNNGLDTMRPSIT